MAPPAAKPRKFRPHWALQYALAVAERDPQTGLPTKAVCLMCRAFERDETEGAKRRKRQTKVHCFAQPWRPDNMRRHLEQQHARRWTQYKALGDEAKRRFFPADVAISTRPREATVEQLQVHHVAEHNAAVAAAVHKSGTFLLDRGVVDELLRVLVALEDDETQLTSFELQEIDSDDEMDADDARYITSVDSMMEFSTIVKFLAGGVTFKQAVQLYQGLIGGIAGLEQTNGVITEKRVTNFCEVSCAVNLQRLKDVLGGGHVWAFAVVVEVARCAGSPFLDVRIRFERNGEIHSVHLIGIVMQDMEMKEESGDLVVDPKCVAAHKKF
ncbi:uncharacterized protein KRP23_7894 [Phytophthora ramorum]|uniref:uncharacterized protein n=1 Tax=Phytophthora ramorum TaxID=164328 RepID=UPI0030B16421|nr:hypothetical protein KRP23_7894 [Phytophthora ramorum]